MKGPEQALTENWGICRCVHQWLGEKRSKPCKVAAVEAPSSVFFPNTVTSWLQGENIVKALSELQTMLLICELCSQAIINQVFYFPGEKCI